MYIGSAQPPCACPPGPRRRGMAGLGRMTDSSRSTSGGGQGAGQVYLGTGCPSGMIATGSPYKSGTSQNWNINCVPQAAPPPPAPRAPAPAPVINVAPVTTVSPNIQTQVSPQISPLFQQSSGSGALTAGGASQSAGGQTGQGGGSGGGMTAADVQRMMAEQEAIRASADARARQDAAAAQKAMLEQLAAQDAAARAEFAKQLEAAQKAAEGSASAQQTVYVPAGAPSPIIAEPSAAALPQIVTPEPLKKPINIYMVGGVVLLVVAGTAYALSKKRRKK
jgi:hypothetical protein